MSSVSRFQHRGDVSEAASVGVRKPWVRWLLYTCAVTVRPQAVPPHTPKPPGPRRRPPGPEPFSRQGLAPPGGIVSNGNPRARWKGQVLPSDGDRQPPGVVCGVGGVLSGPVRCVRSAAGSAFAVLSEFLLDGVDRAGVRRGGGLSATDVFPALLCAFGFGARGVRGVFVQGDRPEDFFGSVVLDGWHGSYCS